MLILCWCGIIIIIKLTEVKFWIKEIMTKMSQGQDLELLFFVVFCSHLSRSLKWENPRFSTLHDLAWVHTQKHKLGTRTKELNHICSHACDHILTKLSLCMVTTLVPPCSALLVLLNKAFLVTVGNSVVSDIRTNYLKTLLSLRFDKTITISAT